jgi:RNA polymerase subunit RPABC4/transcription elongation factor Spt4
MFYLALTFTVLWGSVFGYLIKLDTEVKDIAKRLEARS